MFAPDGVVAAALWSAVPVVLVAFADASGAVVAGAVVLALADASGVVAGAVVLALADAAGVVAGAVVLALADASGVVAGAVVLALAFMSGLLVDVEAVVFEVLSAGAAVLPSGTAVDVSAVIAAGVELLEVLEAVELSDFWQSSEIFCITVTLKLSPLIVPVSWTVLPLFALRSLVLPVSL